MSALSAFQPFTSLPPQVMAELGNKLIQRTYPRDSFVFTQGQQSLGYLFFIDSGLAEITLRNEKGVSSVVGLRHAGEFFGETVLLSGKRYPASVKAREDLSCYLLEKPLFEDLLRNHKEFAGYFNHILTDRLRDLYEEMLHEQSRENGSSEPFKKRVIDIMSSPVAVCASDTPINQIARTLTQQKISSIVVTDGTGKMLGLVRERDLIARVLALDSSPSLVTAGDIMAKDSPTLPPDAFFYQALLKIIKNQGKHIVVIEQGRPIGMVTIGDLTRARLTSSITVVREIEGAKSIAELAQAFKLTAKIISTMAAEKAPANEICEVYSELNDSLTRRLLTLAEENLFSLGLGLPPVEYCWLTMGSGGRKEQTMASDQDNGIIYADPAPEQEAKASAYFAALAQYVVDGLEQCGIPKCPGDIMATNTAWRQSLKEWKAVVSQWTNSPNPDSSRQFTIFLDFRPVYGQDYLAHELRDYTFRLFRQAPGILHHMVIDDLSHRVPLSLFKQVLVEKSKEHKNEVDLKKAACVHIVDCVRIFAMREGVAETNTLGRLGKLIQIGALAAEDAEYYEAAMQSLLMFRIRENLRKQSLGLHPDNYIKPGSLSKRQRTVLRESFIAIDRLQNFTSFSFQLDGKL